MRVQFGIFDFDPETRELRREGRPVRLQAQPAQVLGALLAKPGEVVTREELRETVWGSDTFVDFDRGLNYCVAQIRSALKDSAESPRFVRTIPKQGYQFIAPVAGADAPPVVARRVPLLYWAAAAVLALAGVGAVLVARGRPVNIAVARFDNETGNPEMTRFADGLTDLVVTGLSGAADGRYRIIGNAAILRRPRNERDLKAIASSLSAGYVVLGQVQQSGDNTRLLAHLIRLPQQTHVAAARFDDVSPGQESELARGITEQFLARLGASRVLASR